MIDPQAVREKIAAFLKLPPARLNDAATLTDLVHESFLLIQLVIELQEEFNARLLQEDLKDVKTVQDLIRQIVTHEIQP
jgi:acyl carrier protein